jgi:hypothetical protein
MEEGEEESKNKKSGVVREKGEEGQDNGSRG